MEIIHVYNLFAGLGLVLWSPSHHLLEGELLAQMIGLLNIVSS